MKKAALFVLSILFIVSSLISCEHNVYIDDEEDVSMNIWRVGKGDSSIYFETANEAIEYIMSLNVRSVIKTEDPNRTVTLMRPVLAENSDGIVDESYEEYVADESLRGSITVPEGFTGNLCIDFNNYRYDFANTNTAFFVINGGDNVYIYNGTSVIFNEASHEPYAVVVDTRTVTIGEHLLDDRRTDPNAMHVTEDGGAVVTSATTRDKTLLKGDFNIEGSLEVDDGVVYIDSITKAEGASFTIRGGEIHNSHDCDDVVIPAIDKEEFEKNGGEHNYIHTWSTTPLKEEVVKTATCKEEGLRRITYKCTQCDATTTKDEKIEKTDHDHSGAWVTTDGENHWRICPVCESEIDKAGHTFTDWTEGTDKIWRRSCSVCYRAEENAHLKHDIIHHEYTAPTCEVDGNIEYWSCSICGECFSDKDGTYAIDKRTTMIDKLGHNWDMTKWANDGNTHWRACKNTGCTARNEESEHINEYYYSALATLDDGTPFLTISHKCNVCERSVSTEHREEDGVFHLTPLDGFTYAYDRDTGIATVKLSSPEGYTSFKWYDIDGKSIKCLENETGVSFQPDGRYGFRCELIKNNKVTASCYIELTQYKN